MAKKKKQMVASTQDVVKVYQYVLGYMEIVGGEHKKQKLNGWSRF